MTQKDNRYTYKDEYSDNSSPKAKKKKKKSGVRVLPVVITIIAIIIMAVVVYAVYVLKFYKPDTSQTNQPSFQPIVTDDSGNQVEVEVESNDNIYNFLVLAKDKVSGLTDVMMIVNYNIDDQAVSVMQIPRDTYVELENYNYHKINGAYSYFFNQYDKKDTERDRKAVRDLADFIELNLCIEIHYTALMDIQGFASIVDAVGGVDMYVPQDMKYIDKNQGLYIDLKQGWQHLDGNKAEQFVRCRSIYPTGDLGRQDAQKLFISAFIKKVTSSLTDINTVTNLATTVASSIKTDLNVNDIVFFGKYFVGLGGKEAVNLDHVVMLTMPGQAFMNELSYYSINRESVVNIVDQYFNIYNFSIATAFDSNGIFLDSTSEKAKTIYTTPASEFDTKIYNGDEIDQSGLN